MTKLINKSMFLSKNLKTFKLKSEGNLMMVHLKIQHILD